MLKNLKSFFQYIVILGVTVALIWVSLRSITVTEGENKWDFIYHTWQKADKGWLLLMAGIATLSHIIRAERWRLLMEPAGRSTTLSNSFLSLMVGYLVNLVIPRGGEVSRCYNLYKLDKTPVEVSFGTVVVERIIDFIFLLILIGLAFAFEARKLFAFIASLPIQVENHTSKIILAGVVLLVFLLFALAAWWFIRRNKKLNERITKTLTGFREGLLSIFKLQKKGLFLFYSVFIWFLYFAMSYTVILAFPQTQDLGFSAVLSLFAIGAIAMAVPLPGGAGSYHVLVPQGLVFLYSISKSEAVAFTFIFHGWQTAIMIVGGAVSLILTSLLIKKN